MIVKTQSGWDWGGIDQEGQCCGAEVQPTPRLRVSALLGADGEPLMIEYERHPIGFRLARKDA